jgi:2-alkyl-3-oxoalkanoate reductase
MTTSLRRVRGAASARRQARSLAGRPGRRVFRRVNEDRGVPGSRRLTVPSQLALTGATGFIGAALLPRLVSAGWGVRALYRPRAGRVPPSLPGVEWLPGDLTDDRALDALVAGTDAIVHCAGAVRGATRADFDRVNAEGAGRVASAAAHQPRAPRFLLISSLAARMPELSAYAASKREGERAVAAALGTRPWTVLRPCAVFGPGDRELLPLFRCIARGFVPLPGRGAGRFSLIYVDDVATAVTSWLAADTGYGETFELDDTRPGGYDWDTVVKIAGRVLRNGAPVRRVPVPVPALDVAAAANLVAARLLGYAPMFTPGKVRELTHPDWLCDSRAFAQATGWRPAFGLETGLARAYGERLPA